MRKGGFQTREYEASTWLYTTAHRMRNGGFQTREYEASGYNTQQHIGCATAGEAD